MIPAVIKTWRQRVGKAPDYPLDFATPVERAMVEEIAELRAEIDRLTRPDKATGVVLLDPRQLDIFKSDID